MGALFCGEVWRLPVSLSRRPGRSRQHRLVPAVLVMPAVLAVRTGARQEAPATVSMWR